MKFDAEKLQKLLKEKLGVDTDVRSVTRDGVGSVVDVTPSENGEGLSLGKILEKLGTDEETFKTNIRYLQEDLAQFAKEASIKRFGGENQKVLVPVALLIATESLARSVKAATLSIVLKGIIGDLLSVLEEAEEAVDAAEVAEAVKDQKPN